MSTQWPSFEELAKLAKENPEKLEQFREQEVEKLIQSSPNHMHRRLRGLQFQIDCTRRLQKTPMASCLSISKMMQESLRDLNEALHGHLSSHTRRDRDVNTTPSAKVLRLADTAN